MLLSSLKFFSLRTTGHLYLSFLLCFTLRRDDSICKLSRELVTEKSSEERAFDDVGSSNNHLGEYISFLIASICSSDRLFESRWSEKNPENADVARSLDVETKSKIGDVAEEHSGLIGFWIPSIPSPSKSLFHSSDSIITRELVIQSPINLYTEQILNSTAHELGFVTWCITQDMDISKLLISV